VDRFERREERALFHKMVEDKIAELLPDLPARVERKIEMTLNAMVQAEVKRRLHTLAEEPKT
jgi:Mg/Co/Ni transporter MgtE